MNRENIQNTRMCMKTYFNLYGRVPSIRTMIEWTGLTFAEIFPIYMAEISPKTGGQAA